ncbi:hypothetical protein BRARA_E01247, partial [Brassica rapa]
NPWKLPGSASALCPPLSAAGEPPPPLSLPPDPPDPSTPLSPHEYPPLSFSPPSKSRSKTGQNPNLKGFLVPPPSTAETVLLDVTMTLQPESPKKTCPTITGPQKGLTSNLLPLTQTGPLFGSIPQTILSPETIPSSTSNPIDFSVHKPKSSSPLLTNKAVSPIPPSSSVQTEATQKNPPIFPPPQSYPQAQTPSLVERLRASEDKTLQRLAPFTISETGRPRVLIPDVVFEKGAELHKDFIVCYYNGKPPPFNQIQSVFNHMWGKGKKLEIHNNPLNRSTLVRIPSDYLRQKILEKCIWYVGDSMFHTAQWSSEHSMSTPPLKAIRIWAHLIGVPLDLRYNQGLSLVAGLVGEPKETDDFTRNLVSLTVSHVKVEVDLTKPLPSVVEFERQSGEVVEVQVSYPWTPPTCSHCHELGHIVRNCLLYTPPPPPLPTPQKTPHPAPPLQKTPFTSSSKNPRPLPAKNQTKKSAVFVQKSIQTKPLNPPISTSSQFDALINLPTDFSPAHLNYQLTLASTPEPPPRPSLKRSRSSPTLSPPHLSKNTCPNPFILHTSKSTLSLPPNPIEPILTLPPIPKAHPDIFASPNCPKKL